MPRGGYDTPEIRSTREDCADVDVSIQPVPEVDTDKPLDITIINGTLDDFENIADGDIKKKPPTFH